MASVTLPSLFSVQLRRASDAGAAALIITNDRSSGFFELSGSSDRSTPMGGVPRSVGSCAVEKLHRWSASCHFTSGLRYKQAACQLLAHTTRVHSLQGQQHA
eukprot:scaffold166087_cov23-Tisochrysis_lutea.AAC.1